MGAVSVTNFVISRIKGDVTVVDCSTNGDIDLMREITKFVTLTAPRSFSCNSSFVIADAALVIDCSTNGDIDLMRVITKFVTLMAPTSFSCNSSFVIADAALGVDCSTNGDITFYTGNNKVCYADGSHVFLM